jgi:hypothetical protein
MSSGGFVTGAFLHGKGRGENLRSGAETVSARRLRRSGAIQRENARYA